MVKARMTAAEYATLPETTQPMELINGEVFVSPAPRLDHQRLVLKVASLLQANTEEGEVIISPMDVYPDEDPVLPPDVFWVSPDNTQCRLEGDEHVHSAPDLVVEVLSPRTAVRDNTVKFELYQQHGIREYWIVETSYVEVWRLADDAFTRVGVFGAGQSFTSAVLSDRVIQLAQVF